MGMFDSIVLVAPIKCLKCRSDLKEFQTKDLDRLLDVYKEGNIKRYVIHYRAAKKVERNKYGFPIMVPDSDYHYEDHPKNKTFYAYDFCEKCQVMVGQHFKFDKNGKLMRFKHPVIERHYGKDKNTDNKK